MLRRPAFAPVIALLILASGALAQLPDGQLYDAGQVSFSYVQTPFPGYSGNFAAEGPGLPPDGQLPPGQVEAVGGVTAAATADSMQTAFYAVVDNQDGTYDVALGAVRTLGAPTPGTYPVDLANGTSLFGFIDDAQSVDLPDTLDQDSLVEWLLNLPAAHKLISTSGSITLAGADADTLYGTFSGTTVDVDNFLFFVNVDNGQFNLSGVGAVLDAPPAVAAPRLSAAPNPFNPLTEVRFALPADAASVRVDVVDAAGRLVRTLHDGPLAAGPQRLAWDGRGRDGTRVAAGTYLVRARAAAWQAATKVTLVP